MCVAVKRSWSFVYCVIILCVFLLPYVYLLRCVCIAVLHTLDTRLLARSQYPEGRAIGHLGTGFSLFHCVYKQNAEMVPKIPSCAITCFSCSPPYLNFLDPSFIFMYMHNDHCHRLQLIIIMNLDTIRDTG